MGTNPRVLVVGLLGGVASGKSTVASLLGKRGAEVLDADQAAREVLGRTEILESVRRQFGEDVFDADGSLNRKKLASVVFRDPEKRKALEELIHPPVRRILEERLKQLQSRPETALAVLDVPLLLEGGLWERCDVLVFVESPETERTRRVRENRDWDAGELAARERTQAGLETKKEKSDYTVRNSGSLEELERQVDNLFQSLIKRKG